MKTKRIVSGLLAVGMLAGYAFAPEPAMLSEMFSVRAYAASDIAVDETNFPDTVFREYVKKNFDTDGDDMLSAAERNAAVVIDIKKGYYDSSPKAETLKGIEYFGNLQELHCFYNNIAELDLSKNRALTILNCGRNPFTEIDLSKNKKLKKLYIAEGKFEQLDLSANTELEYVYAAYGALNEIYFAEAPALTDADIGAPLIYGVPGTYPEEYAKKNTMCRFIDVNTPIDKGKTVKQIACGGMFYAVLTEDGSLYTWGYDSHGIGYRGDGKEGNVYMPGKILDDVAYVTLGPEHGAAIKTNGDLYMWGRNDHGQVGNGTTENCLTPVKVMENVIEVSLGDLHSAAITADGRLYTWGYNYSGQLGNGKRANDMNMSAEDHHTPNRIMAVNDMRFVSVGLGANCGAAVSTLGGLYTWGENYKYQLGDGTRTMHTDPIKITPDDNPTVTFASVSVGDTHCAAITGSGDLYMWGDNYYGGIGDGTTESCPRPKLIMENVKRTELSRGSTLIEKTDGTLYVCGDNNYEQLCDGTERNVVEPKLLPDSVVMASLCRLTGLTLDSDKYLHSRGYDLGVASIGWRRVPLPGYTPIDTAAMHQPPAGTVEIDEFEFPDPIFREYVSKNFDTDGDGVLSPAETAKVEKIDVSGTFSEIGNITSLKGIEYFTALKTLYCYYNQISELDVSNNTTLTALYCDNNQLTELDVRNNTAIIYLVCGANPLTELDVSKNTELTFLSCDNNQLTKLDLSKNTAFTKLNCSSNQLTELDVSKNTKLTELYCYKNQLTELDVSNNTELKELSCFNNQLTELDVSKNTELITLDCRFNQLTKLDLSQNSKLQYYLSTDKTITIYGIAETYPETYAKENGIKFIDINAPAPTVTGTITVSGKDETTDGVSVTVTDADGKPCSVDIDLESGELSISGLSDGTYTLTITKSKYCPRDCTVTIAGGQMTGELDVKLQKYGDIDNTGEINISDALQIVNFRNSKTSSFDKASGDDLKYLEKLADINNDGQVNINDALQIVNFRNGKASSFDKIA